MNWQLSINDGRRSFRLRAEMTWATYQIEDITVTADGVFAVLQNNRPLLVAIESILPITWKIIEGEVSPALLVPLQKALEVELKKVPVKSNLDGKIKVA